MNLMNIQEVMNIYSCNKDLIQNSQAVKKECGLRKTMVKRDVKLRWRPRNGCDGRSMVKILITTIQVNFVPRSMAPNSPELSLLKVLPLTYDHSHFLAATLDFTSFFHHSLSEGCTLFTAWLFWIRFQFFLYLYTPKPAYGQL